MNGMEGNGQNRCYYAFFFNSVDRWIGGKMKCDKFVLRTPTFNFFFLHKLNGKIFIID
jgi:hypothetical protein